MEENNKNPSTLYHYTSIQGLIGIIESKTIWATSIYHLNDKQELYHSIDLFLTALDELLEKYGIQKEDQKLGPLAAALSLATKIGNHEIGQAAFLTTLRKVLLFDRTLPLFISSFSEEGNQLSQWMSYCKNSPGFSIGFNFQKLKNIVDHSGNYNKIVKCIYNVNDQKEKVDEFSSTVIDPEVKFLTGSEDSKLIGEKVMLILYKILIESPILKNYHFKDEKEWRLIYLGTFGQCHFRPGKTVAIPGPVSSIYLMLILISQ